MDIDSIYEKYQIPPNLRRHMKLVARVGRRIADCCSQKIQGIDPEFVERLCLVHDMGNILKFDFSPETVRRIGPENPEKWIRVKEQFQKKYGNNELEATLQICREAGFLKEAEYLERLFHLKKYEDVLNEDWVLKILVYADLRVSPYGIVSLDERIRDLCERYRNKGCQKESFSYVYELEKQIEENCGKECIQGF